MEVAGSSGCQDQAPAAGTDDGDGTIQQDSILDMEIKLLGLMDV